MEDILGIPAALDLRQATQLGVAIGAPNAVLPHLEQRVDVGTARERRHRGTERAGGCHPLRILGWISPRVSPEELDERVAVAECGVLVADVGDGAPVRLKSAARGPVPAAPIHAPREEGLDRAIGKLAQVMATRIATLSVVMIGVAAGLELEVAHVADDLVARRTDGPHRPRVCPRLLRIADPDEADHDDWSIVGRDGIGGQRRLVRRIREEVAPAAHRLVGIGGIEDELHHRRLAGNLVQAKLELRDDPEVAAATAERPEEVGVLVGGDSQPLAIGGDERIGLHVVAGEPELAGQPAHASAEGQAAHAGMGDVPRRRGQSVLLGGPVERAQQSPAADRGTAGDRVDPDAAHRRQIDHEAAVRHGQAEHAVPAAFHADLEARIPAVENGSRDVGRARATRDERRAPVNHRVPHRAMRVVFVVPRGDQDAVESSNGHVTSRLRCSEDAPGARDSSVRAAPSRATGSAETYGERWPDPVASVPASVWRTAVTNASTRGSAPSAGQARRTDPGSMSTTGTVTICGGR